MADTDKIFIKGLELNLRVGIYDHEKAAPQRVLIDLFITVESNQGKPLQSIDEVVSYEKSVKIIRAVSVLRHYDLLENLAEEIMKNINFDNRIRSVTLSLAKPDIIEGTQCVGIEITRVFTA